MKHAINFAALSDSSIRITARALRAEDETSSATDMRDAVREDQASGVQMSTDAKPDDGAGTIQPLDNTPPEASFEIDAYNGGPMQVAGWDDPVIIDARGVRAAAANIPIYVFHEDYLGDPTSRIQQLFGQTEEFVVDQQTGKITARGRITGSSELVKEVIAHNKAGFRWQASINALPSLLDYLEPDQTEKINGRDVHGPCIVARAAICDHIAIVPLGADSSTSARIAAEAAKGRPIMDFKQWLKTHYDLDEHALTLSARSKFEREFKAAHSGGATSDPIAAQNQAIAANLERVAKINEVAKDHPTIGAQAIRENWTVEQTELAVLRAERKGNQVASIISSAHQLPKDGLGPYINRSPYRGGRFEADGGRISDDLCRVIEAGALISAGYSADRLAKQPEYGERVVVAAEKMLPHGIGPLGLARMAARFAGIDFPDDRQRAYQTITAEFSTLQLPVILSNLMNKLIVEAYVAVDPDGGADSTTPAWQKFVRRSPVQDFKPHFRLRLTSDFTFQPLGPTGELQSGKLSEESYQIRADTKGLMFGISRKDIINDDLSVMSTLPTHYGIGAGETVAKSIYSLLFANNRLAYQSDGTTAFFTATDITADMAKMRANLLANKPLSFESLEDAYAQFMLQTKPNGAPLGANPRYIIVPPGLRGKAMQLFQSTDLISQLVTSSGSARGTPSSNPLAGKFQPVVSGYLANASLPGYDTACLTNWYLTTGADSYIYPIEAGFLNGQEMPIVERNEMTFNQLGIAFRGFIDYGVAMANPRAIVLCAASTNP